MANVAVGVKLRWDLISFCVRTRYIALLTLFTFTIVWKAAVMRQEHLYDKEDQVSASAKSTPERDPRDSEMQHANILANRDLMKRMCVCRKPGCRHTRSRSRC